MSTPTHRQSRMVNRVLHRVTGRIALLGVVAALAVATPALAGLSFIGSSKTSTGRTADRVVEPAPSDPAPFPFDGPAEKKVDDTSSAVIGKIGLVEAAADGSGDTANTWGEIKELVRMLSDTSGGPIHHEPASPEPAHHSPDCHTHPADGCAPDLTTHAAPDEEIAEVQAPEESVSTEPESVPSATPDHEPADDAPAHHETDEPSTVGHDTTSPEG